jgi:hypothetical protein
MVFQEYNACLGVSVSNALAMKIRNDGEQLSDDVSSVFLVETAFVDDGIEEVSSLQSLDNEVKVEFIFINLKDLA